MNPHERNMHSLNIQQNKMQSIYVIYKPPGTGYTYKYPRNYKEVCIP